MQFVTVIIAEFSVIIFISFDFFDKIKMLKIDVPQSGFPDRYKVEGNICRISAQEVRPVG